MDRDTAVPAVDERQRGEITPQRVTVVELAQPSKGLHLHGRGVRIRRLAGQSPNIAICPFFTIT